MTHDALRESYERHGQGQVFRFWSQLDDAGRARLASQAAEVDPVEVNRLVAQLLSSSGAAADYSGLEPSPYIPHPLSGGSVADWAAARFRGEEALRSGRVAVFTVAGGQGTRLGYDGPKGTYPVTPIRRKSLFQVFAEKIGAAGRRYGRPLHWFIMTSHQNHEATEAFLAEHRWFGLDRARVHCFRQGRMPAVDHAGRILLEAPDAIALSPDGHGGSLRALVRSGAAALMREEKVDTLSYFQVDNPLVRSVDPAFIGFHLAAGSEMSSKMIPKAYPDEKLGHFCLRQGRLEVVEYSDLPRQMQHERGPDGQLRFLAGSIAIHVLDRAFIERMGGSSERGLPFHRADKKVPCLDEAGALLKPQKPNAVKFEMFVFDALPFAARPAVIETRREDDFSPVKNAEGLDSPATCRDDQLRQFARWANACGGAVPVDASGLPAFPFEVAPAFGYDEASFADSWSARRPALSAGAVLE